MKRIAICDDNELQRQLLGDMLKRYFRKVEQEVDLVEYSCGENLIADVEDNENGVELIFLDILLGGGKKKRN